MRERGRERDRELEHGVDVAQRNLLNKIKCKSFCQCQLDSLSLGRVDTFDRISKMSNRRPCRFLFSRILSNRWHAAEFLIK